MPLSGRDRDILEFERSWWSEPGAKETRIRDRFELSSGRYYQILAELTDSSDAMEHDPLLVRRLRRMRTARRRKRGGTDAAGERRGP